MPRELLNVLHSGQFMPVMIMRKVLLHLIWPRFMAFCGQGSKLQLVMSALFSGTQTAGECCQNNDQHFSWPHSTNWQKLLCCCKWGHLSPFVLAVQNIHTLVMWLCRECSALREAGIPCYFEDLQHMVPHQLCSKPTYWLIWVISEENVTNLGRKCCNWIFFNQDYMELLSEMHVEAPAVFLKQPCSTQQLRVPLVRSGSAHPPSSLWSPSFNMVTYMCKLCHLMFLNSFTRLNDCVLCFCITVKENHSDVQIKEFYIHTAN